MFAVYKAVDESYICMQSLYALASVYYNTINTEGRKGLLDCGSRSVSAGLFPVVLFLAFCLFYYFMCQMTQAPWEIVLPISLSENFPIPR